MRQLDLTVFEPGDTVGTMSQDGHVALWTVTADGDLVRADNRLFGNVTGFTLETRHRASLTFRCAPSTCSSARASTRSATC